MTDDEWQAIDLAAASRQIDRSTLVRHVLRDWITLHGPGDAQVLLMRHGGKMPPDPDPDPR